jgi:hypothetical protein
MITGLILGDVNTTCGSCHQEALVDEVHMGNDMTCVECHQTKRTTEDGIHVLTTGHTMTIDPGVCSECHGNTHLLSVRETNNEPPTEEELSQVDLLETQVATLEDESQQNRNTGIIGGALGALLVMMVLYILYRFRSMF